MGRLGRPNLPRGGRLKAIGRLSGGAERELQNKSVVDIMYTLKCRGGAKVNKGKGKNLNLSMVTRRGRRGIRTKTDVRKESKK